MLWVALALPALVSTLDGPPVTLQGAALVLPARLTEPERLAVARLQARAWKLTGCPLPVLHRMPSGRGWIRLDAEELAAPLQSYSLMADGDERLIIRGSGTLGRVWGLADLRRRLFLRNGTLSADLSGLRDVETPPLQHRAAYLNIAYGFSAPPLSPDTWSEAEWEAYLDRCADARLTHVHFFLWSDCELAVPESALNAERNRRLHQRLQGAIRSAHRRGLKVGFWFSPSLVPRDVWEAHPELHAESPYPGFPIVCVSKPGSWPLMERICAHELAWFVEADMLALVPYDPGGCICRECRSRQPERLARLTRMFRRVADATNPEAELIVCQWASWAIEREIGHAIREPYLARVKGMVPKAAEVLVMDTLMDPGSALGPAKALGFRRLGFDAFTDWETAWWFPNTMFECLADLARRAQSSGVTGLATQCLRPGSKFSTTALLAELMWDPAVSRESAFWRYALEHSPDETEAGRLSGALQGLDEAALRGATAAGWLDLAGALDDLPSVQAEADGAQLLALAARAHERPDEATASFTAFAELQRRTIYRAVPIDRATFDHLGEWCTEGWHAHHF